jgi:uncharacterized protein (DUF885 family)
MELREDAKVKLGDKFDLREYHNVVLGSGSVPLPIMADNVAAWIKETNG